MIHYYLALLISFTGFLTAKVQHEEYETQDLKESVSSVVKAKKLKGWRIAESKAQNAVVQVWSQKTEFNWVEPYKSPEQYQVCGSAFFINENGDLLTNFHVVNQAKSVFINVPSLGKKLLEVKVIGVCPELDVALLSLTQESYDTMYDTLGQITYLELGDSDALSPTQEVLALGFPLGFRYIKSTVGVIAGREYYAGEGIAYLHITAAINPGNSGGPLLDKDGKVGGINTAIIREAQGIGYIVPINEIKSVLPHLYQSKLYRKPFLGIAFNHATNEHSASLNNPVPGGVYINYVHKGSAAEKAGIKIGDMLYEVNCSAGSYKIDEYGDVKVNWRTSDKVSVSELLMRLSAGEPLNLVLYRNGEKLDINCSFDVPDLRSIRWIYPDYEADSLKYITIAGMCCMQLRKNHFIRESREDRARLLQQSLKKYQIKDSKFKEAVVITQIFPGSLIHKVDCFRSGTVIKTVNGKKIHNLDQLEQALLISATTKELAITDEDNVATVLSLDKILKDEPRLARDFMFPISDVAREIYNTVNNKQQSDSPEVEAPENYSEQDEGEENNIVYIAEQA